MSDTDTVQGGKQPFQTLMDSLPEGAGSVLHRNPKETQLDAEEAIQDEAPEVTEQEDPVAESEDITEPQTEEDVDGYLAEEEGESNDTDSQEESDEVSPSITFTNHDGDEVTWNEEDLQRIEGLQRKFNKDKDSLAAEQKRLDDQANTLEYFKVQNELAPEYYGMQKDQEQINAAKAAWAKGEDYQGVDNDSLQKVIAQAEYDLGERWKSYESKVAGLKKPGETLIQDKFPDIATQDESFFEGLEDIGEEFGYTQVERNNADYRQLALVAEIDRLRKFESDVLKKREEYAAKRQQKNKGKVATKSTPSKSSKQTPNPKESEFNIDEWKPSGNGLQDARDLMKHAGGALRR